MNQLYQTPEAFDRALKKAIAARGGDSGELYRQMLRDRFLCRVFSEGGEGLVLKGGSVLLARIPDARSTRDIDFGAGRDVDADRVIERLNALAAKDLGDWCRFKLTKRAEMLDENGYSRLLKLRYATFIGESEKDPVLIDLSLGCSATLPPERIVPANRIELRGIETHDYLAYPLPDQLADKLCAIMEVQPNGWPSSRMKDLVDVITYITRRSFELKQLRFAIVSECAKRSMVVPPVFEAPTIWKGSFEAFARKSGLAKEYSTFEGASDLASVFFNPALSGKDFGEAEWSCDVLQWLPRVC